MRRFSVQELTNIALGIALITVCSWISVPLTIPFTLQTFAVCLVTALLGGKQGCWAVTGYLLLAAAGAPVLSGFKGGLGAVMGVTGGYLLGFELTAATVGLSVRKWGKERITLLLSMAAGVVLCYTFGTVWFIVLYTRTTGPVSFGTALGWCVMPYLIPDAAKILLATGLTRRLSPILSRKGTIR